MRVVTASEMREIDRRAIEEFGMPSLDLMERAGTGAAHVIARAGIETGSSIVIVCGKGNNGGDGFVAGRCLQEWGARVTCWVIGERDELTSDTLRNLVGAEDAGVSVRPFRTGESEGELVKELSDATVAVDALLGTGSKGSLRDPIRRLARILNDSEARVFSLDMPTGMNADTGAVDPDCVHADMTVTFGFPKRGLYSLPARDLCGDITVVDLGYPEDSIDVETGLLLWQEMRDLMPPRDPHGHKGTFGRALVVAGSRGMIGAACLASEAALRSGAGLVKLLVPESLVSICATKLTEVMVWGLPEGESGSPNASALEQTLEYVDEADAVLVGPGLSMAPSTQEFVRSLVPHVEKPLVLDADGLNALAGDDFDATKRLAEHPAILTPHPGELARLVGRDVRKLLKDPVKTARDAAERFGCELVFKGAPTVVASPMGAADLSSLGNDGMATAGSGDVLAGLITGLLAQGYDAPTAARVGVMVHGRAGDICRAELSRRGMIAGDLMRCLPYAWRELEAHAGPPIDDEDEDDE